MIELVRHTYKYFPYELELARREVTSLLPQMPISETKNGLMLRGQCDPKVVERFVYYAGAYDGDNFSPTMQSQLECVNGHSRNRQSTRYSAHGLHEYKGKFNPQIVRAILNILDIPLGSKIIDPFCGSGTSLLECAHLGMGAIGTDINPMAVFVANAKLSAIKHPASQIRDDLSKIIRLEKRAKPKAANAQGSRREYLLSWFTADVYEEIERLRFAIGRAESPAAALFLTIASNLLREYSLQDPKDLRIRRRKTPLPEKPFAVAFEESALQILEKLEDVGKVLAKKGRACRAVLADSQNLTAGKLRFQDKFDCAITSPPYATALPYIDTQRLSLVWLGLVEPSEIRPLESSLVGSREMRGAESKKNLVHALLHNTANIPAEQAIYCKELQDALGSEDGFRRQAVPPLLYRYFAGMSRVFTSLRPFMKKGAPFALIIGSNHTVLGGKRFDIDTHQHLANIARSSGWKHQETIPLQAYQRYGYHINNAINAESLVILEAK